MTLAGMSVLLAEDNPTNQMVAMHMLEGLGAEVTIASDGAEALEAAARRSFDVALIDIEMPRVSGLEVIRRLRAGRGAGANMPLIALTAYVMREHRAEIEGAGADGIIAKPIVSISRFGSEILAHIRQGRVCAAGIPGEDPPADFDHTVFHTLCATFDPGCRGELISRVANDIATACEEIASAIHEHDFDSLRSATHPLIAVAGVIGAARLGTLAQRLNSAGHKHDDTSLGENGAELLGEAERVLTTVCG
jgi:CheY-like chemotaxis protein